MWNAGAGPGGGSSLHFPAPLTLRGRGVVVDHIVNNGVQCSRVPGASFGHTLLVGVDVVAVVEESAALTRVSSSRPPSRRRVQTRPCRTTTKISHTPTASISTHTHKPSLSGALCTSLLRRRESWVGGYVPLSQWAQYVVAQHQIKGGVDAISLGEGG